MSPAEARALIRKAEADGRAVVPLAFPKPTPKVKAPKPLRRNTKPIQRRTALPRNTKPIRRQSKKGRKRAGEWPALREAVLDRDGRTCQLCGATNAHGLTAHHVWHRSLGGPDLEWNLITLCQGPGRSGCHFMRAHGREHLRIREELWGKLSMRYPSQYRKVPLADGREVCRPHGYVGHIGPA